jgi:hypothetical protein
MPRDPNMPHIRALQAEEPVLRSEFNATRPERRA